MDLLKVHAKGLLNIELRLLENDQSEVKVEEGFSNFSSSLHRWMFAGGI